MIWWNSSFAQITWVQKVCMNVFISLIKIDKNTKLYWIILDLCKCTRHYFVGVNCLFSLWTKKEWENVSCGTQNEWRWLKSVTDSNYRRGNDCTLYKKISVALMGINTVKSHMAGESHKTATSWCPLRRCVLHQHSEGSQNPGNNMVINPKHQQGCPTLLK